jgi:transposase
MFVCEETLMRVRGEQLHFVTSDAYDWLVPCGHYLRKVEAAFDFSFVDKMCESKYKSAKGGAGRPPEPPQRMFKLLLLMFLYQVKFERELERRANDSVSWRWFCGYGLDEPVASHKTLWAFRKRLGCELFDEIFARLVSTCIERGLVKKSRWHVDATKQDAAATTFSQWEVAVILTKAMIERLSSMQDVDHNPDGEPPAEMDAEMKTLVAEAASKVAKLKKVNPARVLAKAEERAYEADIDERPARSEAGSAENLKRLEEVARDIWSSEKHAKGDADARIGKTSTSKCFCGYLSTAVADEERGIVLSYETVVGNVDQADTFLPAYAKARERAGKPAELAADRAFDTVGIREQLESDDVSGYIPMIKYHRNGNVLSSEHFEVTVCGCDYQVRCPRGHVMRLLKVRSNGSRTYRGTCCAGCPIRDRCTTAKDCVRQFEFDPKLRRFQEQHWAQKKTQEYKDALKRRMSTIEPIFGHGKTFHNLGKCIYRSLVMHKIQTAMSFFAVNLEKLVKYAPEPT